MTKTNSLKLFGDKLVRSVWDDEKEEWFFSIVDVVEILTDSADAKQYIKKMRMRDKELNSNWGTICTPLQMIGQDGKLRKIQSADTKGILRIIQSIPSKKAEPFKMWLAEVGKERIEETLDPELIAERLAATYERKGYTREWINQRLMAISARKELTDEWKDRGINQNKEYAILTDEITKAWSGMSTRQYKNLKGLKKESLRDNMSTTELVLNMLAETATRELSEAEKPDGLNQTISVAKKGGKIAGDARKAIENETGKPVITNKTASQLNHTVVQMIEASVEVSETKKEN